MTPNTTLEVQPDEIARRPIPLTPHQKRLLTELREIAAITRLNYPDIWAYDPDERTARLKLMKDQLIRSQFIMDYAFGDEMLGAAICQYFFGRKRGLNKLWKTKKFRTFNHYILEVLSLTEKLRLVKAITTVPKIVSRNIEALNALRQAKSLPILAGIKAYLEREQPKMLPKSPEGQAIAWALSNWEALTRYAEDGDLEIDNNGTERSLRGLAVGRNYPRLAIM